MSDSESIPVIGRYFMDPNREPDKAIGASATKIAPGHAREACRLQECGEDTSQRERVDARPDEKITRVLNAINQGDPHRADELLQLVYEQLRRFAAQKMALERPGQTLQATALVHEAWLAIVGKEDQDIQWKGRAHFYGAAAEAMRRILVNVAVRKRAVKHGGPDLQKLDIQDVDVAGPSDDETILDVSDALEKLEAHSKPKAELVKLIYFAGMTFPEAAAILDISVPTANRWWAYSRSWLYTAIQAAR